MQSGMPSYLQKDRHIASRIKQDSKEGGKTKQEQCRCNEDHAESSEMMFHCRLQKIHSGKSCDFFFRCEEHDHCSTAADHDRIYKNTKCLYKSCLNRLITFCRCCRTRSRSGTCFIRKQSTFDSIHKDCANTTRCCLSKSKRFLEDPCKNPRQTSDIHHNDQNRDCKITYRHNRHYHIQDLNCRIFTKHDHSSHSNKYYRRIDRRN